MQRADEPVYEKAAVNLITAIVLPLYSQEAVLTAVFVAVRAWVRISVVSYFKIKSFSSSVESVVP